MPNWLTRATGGRSLKADEPPQSFQLTCECRTQHTGQRKGRPQRIVCQSCGSALFVLPKNVYPTLKTRPTSKGSKKRKRAGGPPTGSVMPSTNDLAASVRRGVVGASGGIASGFSRSIMAMRDAVWELLTGSFQSLRRFFTPFRLILASMIVLLLATGFVALRSRALENARQTFRVELEAGQAALAEQDFQTARDHFEIAVAAVDRIGTHDPQSTLVRQLHNETTAITRLAPGSLFEMLDEAEKVSNRTRGIDWNDQFRVRYAETWLVMQAPIQQSGDGFTLDLPLKIGEEHRDVVVQANIAAFENFATTDASKSMIFAAPLIACELDKSDNVWTVTLDGDRGFLWSSVESLRHLGFFASDWIDESEVAALLDEQTELTGAAR